MPRPHADRADRALPLPARWLLLVLAWTSLALGIVGIFVPLLPTVPFVLLAAWAAARSSPRLSHWLEHHPRMGPWIRDWRRSGVVRRRAKWAATTAMSISAVAMLAWMGPRWHVWAGIASMALVLLWLWRRPEHGPQEHAQPLPAAEAGPSLRADGSEPGPV
jgi:uncharacterized membrane protein YbaN (DUF454 family)